MPTMKLPIPPSTPAIIPTRVPAERAESCAPGYEVELALGVTDELAVDEVMTIIGAVDGKTVDLLVVKFIGLVLV